MLAQLIGAEGGRLLRERTIRKTQQAARQRGLRLTLCPRKAHALTGNQRFKTQNLIKTGFAFFYLSIILNNYFLD